MEGEHTPLVAPQANHGNRTLAYVLSLLCCLSSASFTSFSLYTTSFESLGYTAVQINAISIAAEAGLYLCVPILGYVADAYHLSYLGIIGGVTYLAGYCLAAYTYIHALNYVYMSVAFAIIGIACSSVFIGSMVNCARIHSKSALLSIAAPTTAYGLSSLIYSQVIAFILKKGSITLMWNIMAVCLALVGAIAWKAPRIGYSDTSAQAPEEAQVPSKSHLQRFCSDYQTWTLLLTFVLVSGPLEMYQNDLGLLTRIPSKGHPNTATQVGLFAMASTLSRLGIGSYLDLGFSSPTDLLTAVLVINAVTEVAVAKSWLPLWLPTLTSGMAYGCVFTLYPLVVSRVWGIEGFATYWGIFILGPAIGSLLYGLLFAVDLEMHNGVSKTFWICALSMIVSAVIISRLSRKWTGLWSK